MATIYDISFGLCSPFCSYSEEELEKIIDDLFKHYRNSENGLGFDPLLELQITKIR
jgi:hypothetical protein